MASLPPLRRLLLEDFKTQKTWIGPMLLVINNFFESVVGALNKSLTLVQNTTSDIKYVTLASPPTSTVPTSVAWTKNTAPVAVLVGNVQLIGGGVVTLSAAPAVQWAMSSDGKSLQVTSVFGVTPSSTSQYVFTLICIAG